MKDIYILYLVPWSLPGPLALKVKQINFFIFFTVDWSLYPPNFLPLSCFWEVHLKMCPTVEGQKQGLIYSKIWIPKWCKYKCDSWCVYHCGILWWFRMWSFPCSVFYDHWLSTWHCKGLTNHQAVKGAVYKQRYHWIHPVLWWMKGYL